MKNSLFDYLFIILYSLLKCDLHFILLIINIILSNNFCNFCLIILEHILFSFVFILNNSLYLNINYILNIFLLFLNYLFNII